MRYAGRQQREAVVEPGRHLGDVVGVQPGGGQLDRQRQAVEAADDLGDQRPLIGVGLERRRHRAGPLDEQLHRRRVAVGRATTAAPRGPARRRPAAARGSWPRRARSGTPPSSRSTSAAIGSSTCSQLSSSTTSSVVAEHVGDPLDRAATPGRASMPSAAATTSTRRRRLGASPARTAPPAGRGRSARSRWPTSSSSRVLPTPPGPTSVTSRPAADRRAAARRVSSSRPISDVAGTGSAVATIDGGAGSAAPSSSACWAASAGDGSMPSSSPSSRRKSSYTRSASTRRPRRRQRRHQQLARPLPQRLLGGQRGQLGDDPVGVAACEPRSARTSRARARSSSTLAASARPSSTSSSSGYAGPCQRPARSRPAVVVSARRQRPRRAGRRRRRWWPGRGGSRHRRRRSPPRARRGAAGTRGSAARPPDRRAGPPATGRRRPRRRRPPGRGAARAAPAAGAAAGPAA